MPPLKSLIVLLFLACPGAPAQQPLDTPPLHRILIDDFVTALGDGLSFYSAPARFSGGDWILAGGVVAGTVGIIASDRGLRRTFSVRTEDDTRGTVWEASLYYGDLLYAGLLSGGLYSVGLFAGDENIRITGRLALESLILSGSTAYLFRYVAARSGSGDRGDPWDFKGFWWHPDRQAFPSGWTTIAFALSTVFAEQIGDDLVRVGLYSLAAFTGYARVRFDQHWTSDVLIGAGVGIAAGLHVVGRERSRALGEGGGGGLSVTPSLGGVRVQYTFR